MVQNQSQSDRFIVAVAALIFRDGRVLAMRRSLNKDAGPGLWETLSGRVHAGEDLLDAVQREIREECGLAVRVHPCPVSAYTTTRLSDDMVIILYRADYIAGEVVRSEEHDDHAWLTPEEFAQVCTLPRLVEAVRQCG